MAESFQRLSVSAGSAFDGADVRNGSKTVPPVPKEQNSMKNRMHSMTIDILGTYSKCNPKFRVVDKLPQRVLTNPSEGVANNSADNEEANLICRVHDQIVCSHTCYTILDLLGTGTFGQVFRCQKDGTKEVVAIKIIKNKAAYHSQGLLEIKIARLLNNTFDPKDERHIVRLLDSFEFNNHICLVFELLSMSLLDILTQNQFRGLPLTVVQRFTRQIVAAMVTLEDANIIHCDLKPENILLAPPKVHKKPSPPPLKRKNDVMQEGSSSSVTGRDLQRPNIPGKNGSLNGATKEGHGISQNQNYTITSAPTTPPPALILSPDSGSTRRDADTASAMLSTDVSHAIVTPDNTGQSAGDHSSAAPAGSSSRAGGVHTEEHATTQAGIAQAGGRLSMWSDVKVIDLGSACFEGRTMYSYIQSRFYRSPEVLLGVPYNGAIDMWSLACVCAEMYLGLPLFPGVSQHNQLTRIIEMMGYPPDSLIEGKNGSKYFSKSQQFASSSSSSANSSYQSGLLADLVSHQSGMPKDLWRGPTSPIPQKYRLKTAEEYASETNTEIPILRKYLRYSKLDDVIMKCPLANKARMSSDQKKEEMHRRLCFLNFLEGLFKMNPFERWTAKQAANHPFITNAPFTGQFVPSVDPKINERKLAYYVSTQQKESRSKNSTGHSPIAATALDQSTDGMHVFRPLQFRRLSEPLKMSLPGVIETTEAARPSLQRGQPVRESDCLSSPNRAQMLYQHQSLPYNNSQYMQQHHYMQRQQAQQQQQQQYAELMQTTPEQYSAYSASTPDGMWASYVMREQTASTANREINGQNIEALVKANTQAAALIRSRHAASCDDLPLSLMTGNKGRVSAGSDNFEKSSKASYPSDGTDYRVGQGINLMNQSSNPLQSLNAQQQRPYTYGDSMSGSLPHTRKLSGGQQRHDSRHNQNHHNSPQTYHQLSGQQQQYQPHDQQHRFHQEQQHHFSSNQHQYQAHQPSLSQSTFGPNGDTDINGHPRLMAGSVDSTTGSAFEGFGGSMTDVPMMMTDFGQALMRPELDERRRLHSMQPVMTGREQYDRQRPGQIWQSQSQQEPFSRHLPQQPFYPPQFNQLQHQYNQTQQQHYGIGHNIPNHNKSQKFRMNQNQNSNLNQSQNQNHRMSMSQERDSRLREASVREQSRSKQQHVASSSDRTSSMSSTSRMGGEDSGRSVSFALSKDYSDSEAHNYAASLVVTSRSSSGFISNSTSPGRNDSEKPGSVAKSTSKVRGGSGSSNGKAIGDVTDVLADWDPFFSADDFEAEEGGVGADDEVRGRLQLDPKKGRVLIENGRSTSTGISDRSTDEGDLDPDVDESEWRSAGSRGNSADVNPTPDLPHRKLV